MVREQITLRGTVEAADYTARTVRIRGDQGNVVTLDVPKSVVRFNEVKVGDVVTVDVLRPGERPPEAGQRARR